MRGEGREGRGGERGEGREEGEDRGEGNGRTKEAEEFKFDHLLLCITFT